MALDTTTKAYQGLTKTINKNGHTITEKYVGSKEACGGFLSGYSIGDIGPLGSLQTMNFGQDEGPVWYAELQIKANYENLIYNKFSL